MPFLVELGKAVHVALKVVVDELLGGIGLMGHLHRGANNHADLYVLPRHQRHPASAGRV